MIRQSQVGRMQRVRLNRVLTGRTVGMTLWEFGADGDGAGRSAPRADAGREKRACEPPERPFRGMELAFTGRESTQVGSN